MAIGTTATALGPGRRGGKSPLTTLGLLFAVSVAVNAFFVVGYFRAASLAEDAATPAGAAQIVAERLQI